MAGLRLPLFVRQSPWWITAPAAASVLLLVTLFALETAARRQTAELLPHLDARGEYQELNRTVVRSLFAMQAARRGYVMSHDALFVREYDRAAAEMHVQSAKLRVATADLFGADTPPLRQLDAALARIAAYEAKLVDSIATQRARPDDREAQYPLTLEGEATGHAIERELMAVARAAREVFDERTRELVGTRQRAERRAALLLAAVLTTLLAAYAMTVLQARRRAEQARELAEHNARLESTVRSRTAELAASEQRYRGLVELSADAILVCDGQRRIVYANPRALAIARCDSLAALAQRPLEAWFPAAFHPWLEPWLDALWAGPCQKDYRDAELFPAGGARVPVQLGAVSYLEQGALRVQFALHDVTELRAKEAATREQLRFIDQLVEAMPSPVSMRDRDGRFVRVNRAFEQTWGLDRAELRGRTVFDTLPPDAAAVVAANDVVAMRGTRALVYESRVRGAGASMRHLRSRASALRGADDEYAGVITVDTDVSDMRLKEEALMQANAQLEALSQRLIRSQETERRRIARDLHDQVGQILSALKVALQRAIHKHDVPAAPLQPALSLADEALRHARNLTSTLHPHMLEDLGLVSATHWLLDRFVRPAVAEVEVRAAVDPARSSAERELVAFRVIQESLTNVIRHANASVVRLALETREQCLTIRVEDDGDGFDADSSMFDQQHAGSLGIASMRERVAEAGGHIGVVSTPGAGALVSAVLPW